MRQNGWCHGTERSSPWKKATSMTSHDPWHMQQWCLGKDKEICSMYVKTMDSGVRPPMLECWLGHLHNHVTLCHGKCVSQFSHLLNGNNCVHLLDMGEMSPWLIPISTLSHGRLFPSKSAVSFLSLWLYISLLTLLAKRIPRKWHWISSETRSQGTLLSYTFSRAPAPTLWTGCYCVMSSHMD